MRNDTNNSQDGGAASSFSSYEMLAALVQRHREIKVCWDEEDGYHLQFEGSGKVGCWFAMDTDLDENRETLDDAIIAAAEYHNAEGLCSRKKPIPISANERDVS